MNPRQNGLALLVAVAAISTGSSSVPLEVTAPGRIPPAMRAYVNPITGDLLPEAPSDEVRREVPSPSLQPDDSKLEVRQYPDGAVQVLFHGQRQATLIATLSQDGNVSTNCIESTAALPDAGVPATTSNARRGRR